MFSEKLKMSLMALKSIKELDEERRRVGHVSHSYLTAERPDRLVKVKSKTLKSMMKQSIDPLPEVDVKEKERIEFLKTQFRFDSKLTSPVLTRKSSIKVLSNTSNNFVISRKSSTPAMHRKGNSLAAKSLNELTDEMKPDYEPVSKAGQDLIANPEYKRDLTDIIIQADKISSVFPEFRVNKIKDFESLPLEKFNPHLDPHTNLDYFILKNPEAQSRWYNPDGSIGWRECWVSDYDPGSKEFTVRWKNNMKTKKVRKMNLHFACEDQKEFNVQRQAAIVSRSTYLLDTALRDSALSKMSVPPCRIFFNYAMLEKIVAKARLKNEDTHSSTAHLEQVFDEYLLNVVLFFVRFQIKEDLKQFLADSFPSLKSRLLKETKKETAITAQTALQTCLTCLTCLDFTEHTCQEPLKADGSFMLEGGLATPNRRAKSNEQEAQIIGTVQRRFTTFEKQASRTLHPAHLFIESIAECYHLPLERPPEIILTQPSPYDNLKIESEVAKSRSTVTIQQVRTAKRLACSHTHDKSKLNPEINSRIKTIMCCFEESIMHPIDLFLEAKLKINLLFQKIQALPLYADVADQIGPKRLASPPRTADASRARQRPIDGNLFDVSRAQLDSSIKMLSLHVGEVQETLDNLHREYRLCCVRKDVPVEHSNRRMALLVKSLDHELERSLIEMYASSLGAFDELLMYVTLGLALDRRDNSAFDFLLCRETFLLRHKAMVRFLQQPPEMKTCIHPRLLFRAPPPDLRRRLSFLKLAVRYFTYSLQFYDLRLEAGFSELHPRITAFHVSMQVSKKSRNSRAARRMNHEERVKAREVCRKRLFCIEEYLEEHEAHFLGSLISSTRMPADADPTAVLGDGLTNVTSNTLSEFLTDLSCIEISPSLASCEEQIKSVFLRSIQDTLPLHRKLDLAKLLRDQNSKFDFSVLEPQVKQTIRRLDCVLADAFMPPIAFASFLEGFEYLFVDDRKFLEEESSLLERENDFEPLRQEILRLRKDLKLLGSLPDSNYMGVFFVDIKEFRASLVAKVEKIVEDSFNNVIQKKFEKLLTANKALFEELAERLCTQIDSVTEYIELKSFVNSQDLLSQLDNIKADLRLCRSINDFRDEFLLAPVEATMQYYMSIGWVRDLTALQNDAKRRLNDSGPKFKLELKVASDLLLADLEKVQAEAKQFPYYDEPAKADIYYEKTVEITRELSDIRARASELNRQQTILEMKETNFDVVETEQRSFQKYAQLWEFISYKWSPNVDLWWRVPVVDLNKADMAASISLGSDLLKKLYDEFFEYPRIQDIVKQRQTDVERHQNIYAHVAILKDECFKERHWEDFFNEIKEQDRSSKLFSGNKKVDYKRVSLGDLMDLHLMSYTNFLRQMLLKARAESLVEQSIKETRENIKKTAIKPRSFESDPSGLSVIPNIRQLLASLQEYLSVCSHMLSNPEYPEEFRRELNQLLRLVGFTVEALKAVQKVQIKLVRISPVFKFSVAKYTTNTNFVQVFTRVRGDFIDIMSNISSKEMQYFMALVGEDNDDSRADEVVRKLKQIDQQCDSLFEQLREVFKGLRRECPRYYFFSDEQMVLLCSLLKFPRSLFGLVCKLFPGVQSLGLQLDGDSADVQTVKVASVKSKTGESISLEPPVTVVMATDSNIPLVSMLNSIEKARLRHFEKTAAACLVPVSKSIFDLVSLFNMYFASNMLQQDLIFLVSLVLDHELIFLFKTASVAQAEIDVPSCLHRLKTLLTAAVQVLLDHPARCLERRFTDRQALSLFDSLLMVFRKYEENLDYWLKNDINEFDSFEFQAYPKYGFTVPADYTDGVSKAVEGTLARAKKLLVDCYDTETLICHDSQVVNEVMTHSKTVFTLNVLDHSFEYRKEIVSHTHPLVQSIASQRMLVSLAVAVGCGQFAILRGSAGGGKNSQIRLFAHMLAQNLFELDCSLEVPDSRLNLYLLGTIEAGFFFTFRNLDSASNNLLITLSSLAETIKRSWKSQRATVAGLSVALNPRFAVFCTFRPQSSSAQQKALPINLLESFRTVNFIAANHASIFSVMLSPIMSLVSAHLWAYRLSFFLKIASSDIQQDKFVLSLRVICDLIRVAVERYYLQVQKAVDRYWDPAKKAYRLQVGKLRVFAEKERIGVFTKAFIEVLSEYFVRSDVSHREKRSLVEHLEDVFRDEIDPMKSPGSQAQSAADKKQRDKLLEILQDFVDSNPGLPLPTPAQMIARVEAYLAPIQSSEQQDTYSSHFLVYGAPDSQKSTLIRLLAFVYSELTQRNFRKYWLNLEALSPALIFGDGDYEGLLTEIFAQSHSLDLEEKASGQTKKISYLFQTNADLFWRAADEKDLRRQKPFKESFRGNSWIVFDSNCSKNNLEIPAGLAKIVSMFHTLAAHKEVSHHAGLSSDLKIFYEINTIGNLDPKLLTDLTLIFLETPLMEKRDKIEAWLGFLRSKDNFFRVVNDRLDSLVTFAVLPVIERLCSQGFKENLLFCSTALSLLGNYLGFLEVFLNEFRKYWVVHEFEFLKEHPLTIQTNKKGAPAAAKGPQKDGQWKPFTNQMKLAQQAQPMNLIHARSRQAIPLSGAQNSHYLAGIESLADIVDMETRRLEALCVFCLVHAFAAVVLEAKRDAFLQAFLEVLLTYTKKSKISKQAFACGFIPLVEQGKASSAFDHCFDFTKGVWVRWADVKQRNIAEVSPSFSQRTFSKTELNRLNCQNGRLLAQQDLAEVTNSLETIVGLKEATLVATSESTLVAYFSEFFISYGKSLNLVSEHQQGKSLTLSNSLRRLIEQNRIIAFNFQVQANTDPRVVQGRIEAGFLKEPGNTLRPAKKKTAVVVVEDLHMTSGFCRTEGLLRSLQVQGGWFSHQAKNFYKVASTVFITCTSVREAESLSHKETVNSVTPDLFAKSPMLKMRRLNVDEFKSIFQEVVATQVVSTPTSSKKAEEGMSSELFKNFVFVVFHNIDAFRRLTSNRLLGFNLETFYQFARTVNCLSWKDVNRDRRHTQYVWFMLLKDLISCDLSYQHFEFKALLDRTRDKPSSQQDLDLTGSPHILKESFSDKRKALQGQTNAERRASAQLGFSLLIDKNLKEEEASKRVRSGSFYEKSDSENEDSEISPRKLSPKKKFKSLAMKNKEQLILKPAKEPGQEPKLNVIMLQVPDEPKFDAQSDIDLEDDNSDSEASVVSGREKTVAQATKKSRFFKVREPGEDKSSSAQESEPNQRQRSTLPARKESDSVKSRRPLTIREANEDKDESDSHPSSDGSAEYKFKEGTFPSVSKPQIFERMLENDDYSPRMMSRFETTKILRKNSVDDSERISEAANSDESNIRNLSPFTVKEPHVARFLDCLITRIVLRGDDPNPAYEMLRYNAYSLRKLIFDFSIPEAYEKEDINEDFDMYAPSFEVLDFKSISRVGSFIKSAINSYLQLHPEAFLSIPLIPEIGSNIFLSDFNSLHLALCTEFQHVSISSIKSLDYAKHLVGLISECIGNDFFYYDLLQDDSYLKKPSDITQDTYREIKTEIRENFDKIIKHNKRIVFMLRIGRLDNPELRKTALRIFDLVSAIVFNTDMLLEHLSDQLHYFETVMKKYKLSSHLEEYFSTYLLRNKLESKITFVFLSEVGVEEFSTKAFRKHKAKSCLASFLFEYFPKLNSRVKKLSLNGIKVLPPRAKSSLIEKPLPFETEPASNLFLCAQTIELAYLRSFEKDLGMHMRLKTYLQNSVMFSYLKKFLHKKLIVNRHGEGDSETLLKEQRLLLQRIQRRREILKKEINELGDQILQTKSELAEIEGTIGKILLTTSKLKKKKATCESNLETAQSSIDVLKSEDAKMQELQSHYKNTKETLMTLKEKDFLSHLSFGGFLQSQTFGLYSLLFHELFNIPCEPRLANHELEAIFQHKAPNLKLTSYCSSMNKLLEDATSTGFMFMMKEFNFNSAVTDERLELVSKIISNFEQNFFTKFQADQRLLMFWIDLSIEMTKLSRKKREREQEKQEYESKLNYYKSGLEETEKVMKQIDGAHKKLQQDLHSRTEKLSSLEETANDRMSSAEILTEFVAILSEVQELYLKTSSPFLSYNLDANLTIELLASYIVFWSKYAFQPKRILYYNLIKGVGLDPDLYNEVPVCMLLSSEPPLVSAVNSQVPFNLNMLNNVSILKIAHEATLPFCVVKDLSGLFIRWLDYNLKKLMKIDFNVPSETTTEDIESCMANGQPYVVVDPGEELLRIIRPVIEWRYRRYCEMVLTSNDMNINPVLEITFFQKKIAIKEGFRIVVVLQRTAVEAFDPLILEKTLFMNNDSNEQKIWNETLTEELIILLENELRDKYIKNFIENNISAQIFDKYQELTKRLALFDFISDSIKSQDFKNIDALAREVSSLAKAQEKNIGERKDQLNKKKVELEKITEKYSDLDYEAQGFMNNHYAAAVPGYSSLYRKYSTLAERLRIYQTTNDRFRVYVGDDLTVSPDLFVTMFKESLQNYRADLVTTIRSQTQDADGNIQEIPKELLEVAFYRIERSFFNQIMTSIPPETRYIYSFLAGVSQLAAELPDKRTFVNSLQLFLYSEKIIPKTSRLLSFANEKFYDKFNKIFQNVKRFFLYSSSNLPENPDLRFDWAQKSEEVKQLEEWKDSFRMEKFRNQADWKDPNKIHIIKAIVASNHLPNSSRQMTEEEGHQDSRRGKKKRIGSLDLNIEDDVMNEIHKSDQPDRDLKDSEYAMSIAEKRPSLLKKPSLNIFTNNLEPTKHFPRQLSVEIFIDAKGNLTSEPPQAGFRQSAESASNFKKHEESENIKVEEKSSESEFNAKKSKSEFNFRQAPVITIQKEADPQEKKALPSLKLATKALISRTRGFKSNTQKKFVKSMLSYLKKLMPILLKTDRQTLDNLKPDQWSEFLTLSLSSLVQDDTRALLPALPPLASNPSFGLGKLQLLTFIKYCRPEFTGYMLETFFSEIRGNNFSKVYLDLGYYAKVDTVRKPLVILYSRTHRSPMGSLSRVADTMGISIRVFKLESSSTAKELKKIIDESVAGNVWLVLQNVEMMSEKKAQLLIREVSNHLLKSKNSCFIKVWILFPSQLSTAQEYVMVPNCWPEWLSSCYRVFIGANKSIKEEMVGLYFKQVCKIGTKMRKMLGSEVKVTSSPASKFKRADSIILGETVEIEDYSPSKYAQDSPKKASDDAEYLKKYHSLNSASFDLLRELQKTPEPDAEHRLLIERKKPRFLFSIKFMWSMLRQREGFLSALIGSREVPVVESHTDEEIEEICESRPPITQTSSARCCPTSKNRCSSPTNTCPRFSAGPADRSRP